jgi:hypothetical protein
MVRGYQQAMPLFIHLRNRRAMSVYLHVSDGDIAPVALCADPGICRGDVCVAFPVSIGSVVFPAADGKGGGTA